MRNERTDTVPEPMRVTERERRLILALRQIPPSTLRSRVLTVVDTVIGLGSAPRCSASQADGVPCGDVSGACDSCVRVYEEVHTVVRASFPLPVRAAPPGRLRDTGSEHPVLSDDPAELVRGGLESVAR